MTTAELRETTEYWSAYFAMRIACSLRDIRDREVKRGLREDLDDYLRTKVPGRETREMVTKEMKR